MLGMKSSPIAALCLLLFAAAPAWATEPVPGIDVILSQNPGGRIAATAASDAKGTVTFFDVPEGRYQIAVGNCKLTKPAMVVITSGRDKPITSDPVPVDRTPCVKTSNRGYIVSKGGGAITRIILPNTGTPANATPKAVSGPAPRDAKPLSMITVVLTA